MPLFRLWTWRMAWRDSRQSRRRLFLFSWSIALGVAALVAVNSAGRSMRRTIDRQALSLLGADLVVASRQAFSAEAEALLKRIEALGAEPARETSCASMIVFARSGATRLVQARALAGNFPWYGTIETIPPGAGADIRKGGGVLLEESLANQFETQVGDTVKLGELEARVIGLVRRVPGDTVSFSTIAPRVYLAAADLPKTGLLREGSLARYRAMYRFPDGFDVDGLVARHQEDFARLRLDADTVSERKTDLGKSLEHLERFLNLAAFIALLLGATGIASAVHVHINQKLPHVAILRCLGASLAGTFAVYLAQALVLGGTGILLGVVLGAGIAHALPGVLAGFAPFPVEVSFSWLAVLQAAAISLGVTLLFAGLPLLEVRRVSPLAAIRSAYQPGGVRAARQHDRLRWTLYLAIAALVVGFAVLQTRRWWEGVAFAGGLGAAFGLLSGAAWGLGRLARRLARLQLPFVWRQGLANLHRPNNRTGLLILSLGLGTFLLLTLHLVRNTVLNDLFPPGKASQPNTILFDIQDDQRAGVTSALERQGLVVLEQAPIVTMRLSSLRGRPIASLLAETNSPIPSWAGRREYRSTWRTNLTGGEQLTAGRWVASVPEGTDPIPVSIEEGIAKDLGLALGDAVVFDIQGLLLTNRIASVRKVDWRQVRPNFFFVFPAGVLESAPVMHVMATHVADAATSARMQRSLVEQFPNVSVIDLALVLRTLDDLLARLGLVVRFMAGFTVLTGLVVLVGAILTGRWQRVQEGILLRTLGARRNQIQRILFAEYLALGSMAALAGSVLAVGASWALAVFAFRTEFSFHPGPIVATALSVTALTVIIGLLTSRGVCDQPPLEILRREA